ncbi:gluconate 2-dehydrogenase subunit 3 family protein [Deinococcus peraridilitoris]|uniref:Gluconate 2-dehydrogenase subunit 3 n=1 Tax=Deinococcus peraridilitoris (strain DSM 19664 / LMG 22246 / CIP 109416 / KR-200) TaxID=937777 RepID=L0A630_DEIPD|nr:gluconate 2-dehydrogenase subunit 3 family protein [Deinococcus peraridilitoris]AFZ69306.1 hypothetical protein Deipe_3891 [Deinococcus peraridilitoris DSM 19664]
MNGEFTSPYVGYNVLDKWNSVSWNDQTRKVLSQRLNSVPKRLYLTKYEWVTLEAICGRLIPQPDRPQQPVPITPWIDRKLHEDEWDGYRQPDMPPPREAWRLGLRGINETSHGRHGKDFVFLSPEEQDTVLTEVQHGHVQGGAWQDLPAEAFFTSVLVRTVVTIYYAHPAAWSEIGFGGPASPRGYVRLGADERDPWEAKARHE